MATLTKDILDNISVIYRQEISASGNRLDELKSGLQKYIRRNLPEYAARCGAELFCFIYKQGGKRIFTNLVHRLMIIYLEDIGLAGISIWSIIDKFINQILYSFRGEVDKNGNIEINDLINDKITSEAALIYLIEYLSKLPHSRTLSHFHAVFFPTDSDIEEVLTSDLSNIREIRKTARSWKILPNPDVSILRELDELVKEENTEVRLVMIHLGTAILKQDPETAYECLLSLFDSETKTRSTVLKDEDTSFTCYRSSNSGSILNVILPVLCSCMKLLKVKQEGFLWEGDNNDVLPSNFLLLTRQWYKELEGTKEADLCLRLPILALSTFKKGKLNSRNVLGRIKLFLNVEDVFSDVGKDLEIHSYAIDMHTKKGRSLGKNKVDFVKEGVLVVNEDEKVIVDDYKEIYNRLKYKNNGIEYVEDVKKESDKFLLISRVQLTCSKSRPCTYLAKDKEKLRKRVLEKDEKDTIYFVKGPYLTKEEAELPFKISKLKSEIQDETLPYLEYKVLKLLPDLFEDVPLGTRKKIDKNNPAYFLVCKSLIQGEIDDIPTQEKSSKLWDNETVVDWDSVKKNNRLWQFSFSDITDIDLNIDREVLLCYYVLGLLWRYIIGIPDPADRNFIVNIIESDICNEEVCKTKTKVLLYSLDEENINNPTNYINALKGDRNKQVLLYIKKNWNILEQKLLLWKDKIFMTLIFDKKTTLPMLERVNNLLNKEENRIKLFKE